ncbi:transmembrane protein, putative (macronuclear) [Tetrahymena thermophila SB210]|uniref:Transmembrane protein, putative n=1 Tax=Tetrahymena thermophila (strain SB210) TaxID=312017 RepID=W7XE53_TETTS|nr:transmembrane protein, putative [Tetrahymena thermophila SB210]EWS72221.1 transmembrane protein, putative [Tetrahymena thermophila SB210]|eukprot:XP_012655264.1 transmembrane protein, putative [Tetrahymena thermophila SB210]
MLQDAYLLFLSSLFFLIQNFQQFLRILTFNRNQIYQHLLLIIFFISQLLRTFNLTKSTVKLSQDQNQNFSTSLIIQKINIQPLRKKIFKYLSYLSYKNIFQVNLIFQNINQLLFLILLLRLLFDLEQKKEFQRQLDHQFYFFYYLLSLYLYIQMYVAISKLYDSNPTIQLNYYMLNLRCNEVQVHYLLRQVQSFFIQLILNGSILNFHISFLKIFYQFKLKPSLRAAHYFFPQKFCQILALNLKDCFHLNLNQKNLYQLVCNCFCISYYP